MDRDRQNPGRDTERDSRRDLDRNSTRGNGRPPRQPQPAETAEPKVISFNLPKIKKLNIISYLLIGILIYVMIVVFLYFHSEPIVRYEVVEGSLSENTAFTGICLRDEETVVCNSNGYVNYLTREGQRVAVGDVVYTVDETGMLQEYLEAASLSENSLSNQELSDFRNQIAVFSHNFDKSQFTETYDFKYTVKNAVLKLANTSLLNQLSSSSGTGADIFRYGYAPDTGIVTYWTDGYEDLTAQTLTKDVFDQKKYERTQLMSNEIRNQGDVVYKISKDENWSIAIPVEEEFGERLLDEDYVKVRFLKNLDESWAKVSLQRNDDQTYAILTLHDSMLSFATERYLDIQVLLEQNSGLKIPNSAITTKEFYLIDDNYVYQNLQTGAYYVNLQSYTEAGEVTNAPRVVSVYSHDENECVYYVDDSSLPKGSVLYSEDNLSQLSVTRIGTLTGVYNVNKGYADFKQITVLYQNDEYAIVKSNTEYGLRVYDFIALDAESVGDDDFIN
jgi:hypothetical protein